MDEQDEPRLGLGDPTGGPAKLGARPKSDRAEPYRVLARKYRPSDFTGLVGQEALVRTLRNAFASGRIAHAFMLTGVGGGGNKSTPRQF
jgi:DNA polymerase-3 subunit gamma/tau